MRVSLAVRATTRRRHLRAVQDLDDAALTAKVKASIAEEDKVRATSVNVNTYRSTVQLSGFVDNEEARRRAENAARDVEGVRTVQNDLRIAP